MNFSASVITLDPDSPRFKEFESNNRHLQYKVFKGIRGAEIPENVRIEKGYVTAEASASGQITNGSLGAALSHWSLWQEAVNADTGILIMEDDVITHPKIWNQLESVPKLATADVVFFGLNTNSVLEVITPEGLRKVSLFHPKHPDTEWIADTLSKTKVETVRYSRLLKCFGCCCYFVTPKGASVLSETIFPLRLEGVEIPLITKSMPGVGVDRRMNALFGSMKALIADPFLAYTPNVDSSTSK